MSKYFHVFSIFCTFTTGSLDRSIYDEVRSKFLHHYFVYHLKNTGLFKLLNKSSQSYDEKLYLVITVCIQGMRIVNKNSFSRIQFFKIFNNCVSKDDFVWQFHKLLPCNNSAFIVAKTDRMQRNVIIL